MSDEDAGSGSLIRWLGVWLRASGCYRPKERRCDPPDRECVAQFQLTMAVGDPEKGVGPRHPEIPPVIGMGPEQREIHMWLRPRMGSIEAGE